MPEAKTEANLVEAANQIEAAILIIVEPLITGTIVDKEAGRQKLISDIIRNLSDKVSTIRAAHDEWIKLEWETNENGFHIDTIRGSMIKPEKGKGFLKL